MKARTSLSLLLALGFALLAGGCQLANGDYGGGFAGGNGVFGESTIHPGAYNSSRPVVHASEQPTAEQARH